MEAWSSGSVFACGDMGREIESHLGICRVVVFKKKIDLPPDSVSFDVCRSMEPCTLLSD
jgi:hypothetical protein